MIMFKKHDFFCPCFGCKILDAKLSDRKILLLTSIIFGFGYFIFWLIGYGQ